MPQAARAPNTKIRFYQERSEQGGQDHSLGGEYDHYAICEFIYFREKQQNWYLSLQLVLLKEILLTF